MFPPNGIPGTSWERSIMAATCWLSTGENNNPGRKTSSNHLEIPATSGEIRKWKLLNLLNRSSYFPVQTLQCFPITLAVKFKIFSMVCKVLSTLPGPCLPISLPPTHFTSRVPPFVCFQTHQAGSFTVCLGRYLFTPDPLMEALITQVSAQMSLPTESKVAPQTLYCLCLGFPGIYHCPDFLIMFIVDF